MVDTATRQQEAQQNTPAPKPVVSVQIETGVDRLLKLLHRDKHLELSTAAKELGVPAEIVHDWAEFLEDEKLASFQYSLTKTFLVETQLTKAEVEHKGKEYANRRDAFVRKVGVLLEEAEQELRQLGDLKQKYANVQELSTNIDSLHDDMEMLHHFEELKQTVDRDLHDQQASYDESLAQWHARMDAEEKRYTSILASVDAETEQLNQKRNELADIRKDEEDVLHRVDALQELVRSVGSRLVVESSDIAAQEARITKMRDLAAQVRKELDNERKSALNPMMQISTDQQERIKRLQAEVLAKVQSHFGIMQQDRDRASKAMQQLQEFFKARAQTLTLVEHIERSEHEIHDELVDLILKAKAFDVAVKEGNMNQYLSTLEKVFNTYAQKKKDILEKIEAARGVMHEPKPPQVVASS